MQNSGHLRLCQQPRAAHALRSDQNSGHLSADRWRTHSARTNFKLIIGILPFKGSGPNMYPAIYERTRHRMTKSKWQMQRHKTDLKLQMIYMSRDTVVF